MPRKPRGRNGPPQDSIDSILLAICRREIIDEDTMAHYFDRLDEEWTSGARTKVLHLLRTSDSSAHNAALVILSELATDFDLEEMEDVVAEGVGARAVDPLLAVDAGVEQRHRHRWLDRGA